MIPWKLQFSGIRDYKPVTLDLSGELDHILISGTNGSGKSTISYCLGAVLGSSKVDLEGLRSKNLPVDEVWHAAIHVTFRNDGLHQVDAPRYIRFSLHLEQKPGTPLKKRYQISESDIDELWETQIVFSAGDSVYNFREYHYRILAKYQIDPDAFYLIWYQQEVNQFATMHPEERFRSFSMMTGIDKLQMDWEMSRERVREAEEAVAEAERNQTGHKHNLNTWKTELDKYLDREKRRKSSLSEYTMALKVLEKIYDQQADALKIKLDSYEEDLEELSQRRDRYSRQLQKVRLRITRLSAVCDEVHVKLVELEEQRAAKKAELTTNVKDKEELDLQMKDIQHKIQKIPYTALEVQKQLRDKWSQHHAEKQEGEDLARKEQELDTALEQLGGQISILKVQMSSNEQKEQQSREWLRQYKGSHEVQKEIHGLELNRREWIDENNRWEAEAEILREERNNLQSKRLLSPRQEKSLRFFKAQGIEVYPLRELLELEENVLPYREAQFDAIKYTLFIQGKGFRPPTDLYHVELPGIVPTRTLTHLPEYQLKIKESLDDHLFAIAVKALWWVRGFFEDSSDPYLKDGILIDRKGRRGIQEEAGYILSEKALSLRLQKLTCDLQSLEQKSTHHRERLKMLEDRDSTLRAILPKVKEAEAFFSQSAERDRQSRILLEKQSEFLTCKQHVEEVKNRNKEIFVSIALLARDIKELEGYQVVYQEYEKESEKIEKLQRLEADIVATQGELVRLRVQIEDFSDRLNKSQLRLDNAKREEGYIKREEDECVLKESDIQKKKNKGMHEHLQAVEEMLRCQNAFRELQVEPIERIFTQLRETGWSLDSLENWSETDAKYKAAESKVAWDLAWQQQVDESAPFNYEKVKTEYERGEDEVQRSILILNDVKTRMAELEERLESTIRLGIRKIHDRFSRYMEVFGFEGSVEWEMHTGRKGEIRYSLYIRARKKGHRGSVEDVGVKGRGGKVGKGVSGGEESLSSLLFALALLQTIEASPGFLVLDEFDSALDEHRKERVLLLYERELKRKLIILTPKSHGESYLAHFKKAYAVYHDPRIPQSNVIKIHRTTLQDT